MKVSPTLSGQTMADLSGVSPSSPAASSATRGIRVHDRSPVARHPAREALADRDGAVQQVVRADARRESAFERGVFALDQIKRASRPGHDLRQLRRDEGHRVGYAEARAHRLRDFVERVDFAMGKRDVLEGRRAPRHQAHRRRPAAVSLGFGRLDGFRRIGFVQQ